MTYCRLGDDYDRLILLRNAGYKIPERTLDRIKRKILAADEWYEFDP